MSSSNKHTIDQLFKQKLEDFELTPQDTSWKMLKLIQEKNLRLKRIFYVKSFLEVTVLFSTMSYLLYINKLSTESSKVDSQYTMMETDAITAHVINGMSKEEYISNQIKNQSTQQTKSNDDAIDLVKTQEIETPRSYLGESHSNLTKERGFNLKQEERLLASVSSTIYKSISKDSKSETKKPSSLHITSAYDVYAPVINGDGSFMFFTSRKPITNKEKRKGEGKERIYYIETNKTGWTDMKLLNSPINSMNNFNSAVSLSRDGKSLFIYRDDRNGNGNLYVSHLKNYSWSTPEILPYPINSEFNESSLSMTPDGNTLYFTSNRNGGIGKSDIWVTKKNKAGIWGEAKNLGNVINTDLDEEGVFIHPDGKTLYFSSQGHNSMGGFDIYATTLENGKWTTPVNLGPEINTKNDDLYFVLHKNGVDAYYTSVDPKTPNKKDILKTKYIKGSHQKTTQQESSLLTGTIFEKDRKTPIRAKIEVYKKDSHELIASQESDKQTGSFSIPLVNKENYYIHIYKKGYLYFTEEITTPSLEGREVIDKSIFLAPLESNAQFVLKELSVNEKSFNQDLQTELDQLYQLIVTHPTLNFQLSLEIESENNSIKTPQKIIEKCTQYLRAKGINKGLVNGLIEPSIQSKKPTNTSKIIVSVS